MFREIFTKMEVLNPYINSFSGLNIASEHMVWKRISLFNVYKIWVEYWIIFKQP